MFGKKKKYIKCPICDLNYIEEGQDMCDLCRNNRKNDSIANTLAYEDQEEYRHKKLYSDRKQSKDDYLSIRYNRKNG